METARRGMVGGVEVQRSAVERLEKLWWGELPRRID
jgi:hypothetical protein